MSIDLNNFAGSRELEASGRAFIQQASSLTPSLRLRRNDELRGFALSVWRSLMGVSSGKSAGDALKLLHAADVEYVIIGGIAATLHGCPRVAFDIDICAALTAENLAKLWRAATALNSTPQGPVSQNCFALLDGKERLEGFTNLHLITDAGPLDVLSDVPGVGTFADCLKDSERVDFNDWNCRILGIKSLIKSKIAAVRVKDQLVVMDLEVIDGRNRDGQ